MAKKTIDERLAEIQEKQKQLKLQAQQLKAKQNAQKRKERTRHLIEIGGAVYAVLGREYTEGDVNRLIAFLKAQDMRGNFFSKAMNVEDNPKSEPSEKEENNIF